MTVKIIHSKALSDYYKKNYTQNTIDRYDEFFKEEGEKLAEYIKGNFIGDGPVTEYEILCLTLEYKPWDLLYQINYTNLEIIVSLHKDETSFEKYLELIEKYSKKYKKDVNNIDDYIHYSEREACNYQKIYKFNTIPMFNNCGALVSTHAQKMYGYIRRISGPMLEFKKNIAQFYGFSLLMMTVTKGRYSEILTKLGMEEVHSFRNRRSYNDVLTFVTPIEKL